MSQGFTKQKKATVTYVIYYRLESEESLLLLRHVEVLDQGGAAAELQFRK